MATVIWVKSPRPFSKDAWDSKSQRCCSPASPLTGETVIEIEFFEPEFECPRCNAFWTSEDAISQQKKYEDACEDCGTEEDLIH